MSGDEYQDQGFVFPGVKGQPMRPRTPNRKIERILDRAGLPHVRFTDVRHTCATISPIKEQQGESQMRFKAVDRNDATNTEAAGGGDPTQGVTLVVTTFDA